MNLYRQLEIAVIKTVGILSRYIRIPADIATKTYEYYLRTIEGLVRDLYRGDISEGDFIGSMADLIQAQLTRAWNEGMRANDLDPVEDMEPEWQEILDGLILAEYDYVDNFAAEIVAGRDPDVPEQEGWAQFLARAAMWASRYNDVMNQAIVVTKGQKLMWVIGGTEKHCTTCLALHGIVALSSIWEELDVFPQRPKNDKLECEGWQCDCSLIPVTDRQTRNARQAILNAVAK